MIAILKSVTVGAVGAGLTYFRYPQGTLKLFGQNFSLALGVGMAVLGGSVVAELIHSYVFPHIHALDKMSEPVSAVLAGASNSVGATAVFYLSDKTIVNDLGLPMIVAGAMFSEIVGDYVYTKFVHPMVEK
jgi:hypothetical protein